MLSFPDVISGFIHGEKIVHNGGGRKLILINGVKSSASRITSEIYCESTLCLKATFVSYPINDWFIRICDA